MVVPHIHFETRHDRPGVFDITPELISAARKRNRVPPSVRSTLGKDLADCSALATATAFVSSNDVVTDPRFPLHDLASAAPNLQWIHITGAGIEPLLPLDWLPKGVALTNNSGVHVQKTAEFATMALLMLNARMPQIMTNQSRSLWTQIFTPSIAGKTVVIIGLGDMGGAAAKEAKRLGLRVIGIRRQARRHRYADEIFELRHLRRALEQTDFIFVAAPLTPASRHLLGKDMLASAKRGAGLINVGRAGAHHREPSRKARGRRDLCALIYPSTYLGCTIDTVWYLEMHPLGPDRTRMIHGALFPKDRLARPEFEEIAQNYYQRWDVTLEEDIVASERQQKGLDSPYAPSGRFSHRWIARHGARVISDLREHGTSNPRSVLVLSISFPTFETGR